MKLNDPADSPDWKRTATQPDYVKEWYVFVIKDPNGRESVPAFLDESSEVSVMLPLCGSDIHRVDSLMEMAQRIATHAGQEIKVVHFTKGEVIRTIAP